MFKKIICLMLLLVNLHASDTKKLDLLLQLNPYLTMTPEEKDATIKKVKAKHPTFTKSVGWFLWKPSPWIASTVNWDETLQQFESAEELFFFMTEFKNQKGESLIDIAQQKSFAFLLDTLTPLAQNTYDIAS